jgi:uncharacterized protein (TIGR00266 family)
MPQETRRSHEIDYAIHGDDLQALEVTLEPGETVIAEAGSMLFMEEGIAMETRMGDGSQADEGLLGKVWQGVKRKLTGESLFMTWFTNTGRSKARVSFAAPYPGPITALDLRALGGEIILQKDSFLCAAKGTTVGIAFAKRLGAGLLGGEGFILQRLNGDGLAFAHFGGTVLERELKADEILRVDTGCLAGFLPSVQYDIQMVKGLKSMLFGGEGLFFATLRGPGKVWLQTMPFSRLAARVNAAAPKVGEGSVLGGLGDVLGGD